MVLLREQRGGAGCVAPGLRRAGLGAAALAGVLLLAAGCSTVRVVPPVRPLPSDAAFAWPSVLEQAVDEAGRVDYRRLEAVHGALDLAAAAVGQADLQAMPDRRARLAFLLNASNILWTLAVVRDGIPDRLGPVGRLETLRLNRFTVAGQEMTLDGLQAMAMAYSSGPGGDWRVPLALYCPAVSCPRLARTAYDAAALDGQLEGAARRFLVDPANVVVDPAARVVRVSGVMARTPGLVAAINRYRDGAPVPGDFRVEALPFDWTVAAPSAVPVSISGERANPSAARVGR